MVVPVSDCDSKGSNCQPAGQTSERHIPRLRVGDLTPAELSHLKRTCSYFTDFEHLPRDTRSFHRQQTQRRHEQAGIKGPDEALAAGIAKIALERQKASGRCQQSTLDFGAVESLPRTSQNTASVTSKKPAKAATLDPKHLKEWVEGSGIDEQLARMNLRSLAGDTVYKLLRPLDDGRDVEKDHQRLKDVLRGGWFCSTLSLQPQEQLKSWGCFKPDHPRPGFKKDPETGRYFPKVNDNGKPVPMKYEHPAKVPTREFVLAFPRHIGERIAANHRLLAAYKKWEDDTEWDQKPRTPEDRWRWFLRHGVPLFVTEGAKKTAALLTGGYLAIGLSGVWNGCEKDKRGWSHLKPGLRHLLRDYAVDRVIAMFDWSEPDSKGEAAVRGAIDRLGMVIRSEAKQSGADVSFFVVDLPGPEKGCDDILVSKGIDGLKAVRTLAKPFREWQRCNNTKAIARRLNVPMAGDTKRPTKVITTQFFQASDIPTDAKLVAIIGGMGTNKTGALVDYANSNDAPFHTVLHRRGLGGNCAQRSRRIFHNDGKLIRPWLNNRHREVTMPPADLSGGGRTYWAASIEAQREIEERGKVVVLDSSHAAGSSHLDPEECKGAIVNLEEWDASCWHLFTSETEINKHRADVLSNLTACLRNAKQVICSSAHLSDQVVGYLEQLLAIKAHVLVNDHKPAAGRKCHWFESHKSSHWLEALESRIRKGDNVFVTVTAQNASSVHSAKNIGHKIHRDLKVPLHEILVVDAETTRTKDHDAKGVITDPSLLLKYRVVIATPCIETGVSIDDPNGHFDAVFSFNSGCTTPQAAVQAVGRVRSSVDRFVCIARNGKTYFGGYTTAREVIRQVGKKAAQQRDELVRAGIAETDLPDTCSDNIRAWGELVADHNILAKEFDFSVRTLLALEGYEVTDTESADEEIANAIKDQLKGIAEETNAEECRSISRTTPAGEDEIDELSKKAELTQQQQQELEHAKVCRDYGIEQADERQVLSHRQGGFQVLRNECLLEDMSPSGGTSTLVRKLDSLTAMKRNGITKNPFLGDYVHAFRQPQIQLLHEYGVLGLSRRRDEFTMRDADIVELHERAKRDANRWRTVFNINPATWKLPRGFIDFVLEKIGYRLLKLSQQRRFTNGKQARLYVIQTRFHGIDCRSIKAHISDNITRRFDQAMADAIGEHHDPACSEQQVSVARFIEAAEKPVIDSNATFSL